MNNFFENKIVVVTGGAGFIGSNYILELLNRGAIVRTNTHNSPLQVKDNRLQVYENLDLNRVDDCIKLIEGSDYVIHSAGKVAHPSTVPTDIQASINNI